MIFFIVNKNGLLAAPSLKPPETPNPYRVLPWWSVYGDHTKLLELVLSIAGKDPVCLGMYKQFAETFKVKLDEKYLLKHFCLWCHPVVGNLMRSPKPRTTDVKVQSAAWGKLVAKEDAKYVAPEQLLKVIKGLGEIDCNPIDECRVVRNISELARAFIGDVTSAPRLQIERLFALRLTRSEAFHAAQADLLGRLVKQRGEMLCKQIAQGFKPFEYSTFYVPALLKVPPLKRPDTLLALIGLARFGVWPAPNQPKPKIELDGMVLMKWMALPQTVACAALINDLSKLNQRVPGLKTPRLAGRARPNPNVANGKVVSSALAPIVWGLEKPQKGQGLPNVAPMGKRWRAPLVWSWNRNEYSSSVSTYRVHLCPQWGGSSGHTTGGLSYWLTALDNDLCNTDAITVTTSLYVLWNLCYDIRLSPVHRMVETLEETQHTLCSEKKARVIAKPLAKRQQEVRPLGIQSNNVTLAVLRGGKYEKQVGNETEDAWSLLLAKPKGSTLLAIDTIALVHALYGHFWPRAGKSLVGLCKLLDLAASDLGSFAWLPDFASLANRELAGLNVKPSKLPSQLWTKMDEQTALEWMKKQTSSSIEL